MKKGENEEGMKNKSRERRKREGEEVGVFTVEKDVRGRK